MSSFVTWRYKYNTRKDNESKSTYEFILANLDEHGTIGGKVPSAIATKPDIDPIDIYYISAFDVLSGSRTIGMDIGSILVSEMVSYCKYVLKDKNISDFIEIVQAADKAYLKEYYDSKPKTKKDSKNGK